MAIKNKRTFQSTFRFKKNNRIQKIRKINSFGCFFCVQKTIKRVFAKSYLV